MRRFLLIWLFLTFAYSAIAQSYGNEWINYNQQYFVLKVYENGLYRISQRDLLDANIPLSTIDPRSFQVFSKGKEVPIYIEGENDGVFDATDYIEFYGKKNDGWIDSVLYEGRSNQPNPYYSLITDTINYYLTWNLSTTNKRTQIETAVDFGNYFPAAFIWKEEVVTYDDLYYDGQIATSGATDPAYTSTEGFMSSAISIGNSRNFSLSFNNRYSAGPFINLEIQYAGQSNWGALNNGDHHIEMTIAGQIKSDIFDGYKLRKMQFSFSPSLVTGGNSLLRYRSIDDLNSGVDRSAVAYIKYSYPHTLVLDNVSAFNFNVEDHNSQNKQFLEFINFNGGSSPILYDLTNSKRIRVVRTLSSYRALIPNSGNLKSCFITNESQIKSVNIETIGNTNFFENYEAQNIDSAYLMIYHPQLLNEVSRYANYRFNGGYNPQSIDVEQLYHQFGYGIYSNPLAIRQFVDYAFDNYISPPQYLFLVGKSISHKNTRKNPNQFAENLVPTFGNPSADNLLTSGLQGSRLESPIPIGRISATNLSELGDYLNKVIEYESVGTEKWTKKALHFAGGLSALESNRFEVFLNNYAKEIKSPPFGGDALLFKKSTTIPIQTTLSDSIRTLVNNGVALMTFFGHASRAGGFDISIDSPDKLNNRGKYPVILANSCFSGNYHQSGVRSTAEQYVLQRQKGSIAFIASGNLGFASTLNSYSNALYKNLGSLNYGKSIGHQMIQTVKDIQGSNPISSLRLVCLEMSMQGDPALTLYPRDLPDYNIESNDVQVSPSQVTSDLDSFRLSLKLSNLGKAILDSITLQLNHKFPNGSKDTNYVFRVPNLFYENVINIALAVDLVDGIGINKFSAVIDPNDEIAELDESNNRTEFDVLVRSGDLIPVYPYNYSIVGFQGPSLKASTAFALEEEKQYQFELDTTSDFNSLLKASTVINSKGGVLEWAPSILTNMPDSQVYFWRVSKVPATGQSYQWRNSSFQYINNESGWAQDHFQQLDNNNFLFVNPNEITRQFDFVDNVKELYVYNVGSPSIAQTFDIRYSIDSDVRERNACGGAPAFLIAVLDSLGLDSWETKYFNQNPNNDFGQANKDDYCGSNRMRPEKFFMFRTNDANQMDTMKHFLKQVVPDGNYIVVYSWFGIDYDAINLRDSSILGAFVDLGSQIINTIPNGHPYIFTVKKGDPSSVLETMGASVSDQIEIRRTLRTSADYGEMQSTVIPFSPSWSSLSYRVDSKDVPQTDSVVVQLLANENNGGQRVVSEYFDFNVDTSIANEVDNDEFVSLQLLIRGYDEINQTSPQLKRWQISATEIPDFALVPNIAYQLSSNKVQEGELIDLEIGIKNISRTDGDSLLISFVIEDALGRQTVLPYPKQKGLKSDSIFISRISVPTRGLVGKNTLIVEVNPNNDQIEMNKFNNIGQIEFEVSRDNLNPIIEVMVDGRRILNGEIVSSRPEIRVSLDDENAFLALDDTSAFTMFLIKPNGTEELLNFSSVETQVEFIPASLPENKAIAYIRPNLSEDGIYGLRIQAYDKSGNASGKMDYYVEFEVINKSTITHMLNYPNPFSTSTKFVFTLTGSIVPDQIQIQIMTVTGKVVREIDQFELGPIHIGNNITEFSWDGKDEFGDQLANGVYLYRVKAKINGSNVEKRKTDADQFFVKEFGKMYLLR